MTHTKWWVATLLFLSTVINYVDRQTLSVLAPELRAALSHEQYGLLARDFRVSTRVYADAKRLPGV